MVAVGGGKLGPTICWGGKLGMEKLWMHWADHRPGGLPSPCRPGQHPPPWRLQHQVVVVLHVVVVVVVVVPLASMPVEIQTGQIGHWHWFDMIFSSSVTIVSLAYETLWHQTNNRQIACFVSYKRVRSGILPHKVQFRFPLILSLSNRLWWLVNVKQISNTKALSERSWLYSLELPEQTTILFDFFLNVFMGIAGKPNKFIRWQPSFVQAGGAGI